MKTIALLFSIFLLTVSASYGQQRYHSIHTDSIVIALWKQTTPFAQHPGAEKYLPGKRDHIKRLTNVTNPTITIYGNDLSDKNAPARPAVIICPGGGYSILAVNLEGTEIASWLSSLGFRPVLLKYRVPHNRKGAFADAQRAISILRFRAAKFHINPNKIGIIGFSAGGNLAARLSTHFTHRIYKPVDQADTSSMRPDFGILIYPAYLVNKQDELAKNVRVNKDTPPMFLVQTQDDPIGYRNSLFFYNALTRHHIPAELNMFAHGGHGYGLRIKKSNPLSAWNKRCARWLHSIGMQP
ncbi:MAG TPA: alpha/beta hydrolase [Balneolaceae bacterium]|nr:alpha/beta hydrolase [Balneolaceae bacterium]